MGINDALGDSIRYRTPEAERLAARSGIGPGKLLTEPETWRLVDPDDSPDVFLPATSVDRIEPAAVWLGMDDSAEGCTVTTVGGRSYDIWESLPRLREELVP